MKYLDYTPLDRINDFLSHVTLGQRTIEGCLEAYSCKHTGTDKKLSLSLENEILDHLGKSLETDSSPVEYLFSRSSRKTLVYLLLTLHHIYPDFDFSAVRAHEFFTEESWDSFKQIFDVYMFEVSKGAEKIAEALKENRSITNVDLGGNDIHTQGISAIARVLKDNSTISALELGYNPIGPEGAKALAEVLKFHGNISVLMLGWCQLGATGAEHIADMLRYNSTISSLDLRANGLRDEGAVCLARSLKVVNEALVSLNLGFNEIRDEGAFAIAQALKSNEDVRLTSLNLMNNFLTKLGQSAVADASDHVYEMTEKELTIVF